MEMNPKYRLMYFLSCIYSVFASNIEIGNYKYHMMGQKLTSATHWKG